MIGEVGVVSYTKMTVTSFIERRVFMHIPLYRRGARARAIINSLREAHPYIHDRIHGRLPDTRKLPSSWQLGFLLTVNSVERCLEFVVEEKIAGLPRLSRRR